MSLTNLLSSTRANPQPKDSAHVLQHSNLSTNTSTAIHPVTTTQDIHLQREDTSASQQVTNQQRPVSDGQITNPHQVSNLPGQMAAHQFLAASLPLNAEPTTSRSNNTAIPVLGQLHPPTSLSHAHAPVVPLSQPPPLSQPLPQNEPTAPLSPPDMDMSNLGAIKKTVLSHPLSHSGLINDPSIPTPPFHPNIRPIREKRKPGHLKKYETPSITDKTSGKKAFFIN